ncbi:enoyl-CoA hydratase/isomerase family protein [Elioraea sp.]|uniref:enoyl-CoA hydratase/isomerase family protein n=1 Tax=Elioraea sp. TaxID=2185103 RepID=UPI003F6EA449
MDPFILTRTDGTIGVITLNRPEVLNAWHRPMRDLLIAALEAMERDDAIRAVVLTGAGERAFSAGQDLNESKTFDPDRAEAWIREWERLYGLIRSLTKPLVVALNGLAAGSAFQVALLGDLRVGHPGVTMGQPEINAGFASVTGPGIMRELLGIARTTDLALTGRMMDAAEAHAIGLISRLVPRERVLAEALALAAELAAKPPNAMRLSKAWLREMTEPSFRATIAAAIRIHRAAYGTGEPAATMQRFLDARAQRRDGGGR